MNQLEEKVTILEELIKSFLKKITVVEAELPEFLKSFLQEYKETLDKISAHIETSNQCYDDSKIEQQIDQVKDLIATVPKVIEVKTVHHFGAWSKASLLV